MCTPRDVAMWVGALQGGELRWVGGWCCVYPQGGHVTLGPLVMFLFPYRFSKNDKVPENIKPKLIPLPKVINYFISQSK